MKNKAFTLIEIISVIIIIGIIMIIAVPAVNEYILDSRKNTYSTNIKAYIESAKGMLGMGDLGDLPYEDELILVPIDNITLEKNNTKETPFGSLMLDQSYIIIFPLANGYKYYAYTIDSKNYTINSVESGLLNKTKVFKLKTNPIISISDLSSGALFYFDETKGNYRVCSTRKISYLLCKT